MADRIELEMGATNLLDSDIYDKNPENIDDLLYRYAEYIIKNYPEDNDEYTEPHDLINGWIAVEYFSNPTFNQLLEQWLEEQGKTLEDTVRDYMPYKKGFLMTHGCGYAIWSADLCGGTADGFAAKEFGKWLEEKGFWCERI